MQWQFLDPNFEFDTEGMLAEAGTAGVVGPIADFRSELFPEELAELSPMAEVRQLGFASGRHCAHIAQAECGLTSKPVLRQDRVPIWPRECVGAITHSHTVACAVVSTQLRSVGVDIEEAGRVEEKLYRILFTEAELNAIGQYNFDASTVMFSAKEAGYKAIYPIGQKFVGFKEVEIKLDVAAQTFRIHYLGDHEPNLAFHNGEGCWRNFAGHVITLFWIPQESSR